MTYSVLIGSKTQTRRWIDEAPAPYVDGLRFSRGVPLPPARVPAPYIVRLQTMNPDAWDHGPFLPEIFVGDALLVSDRLSRALVEEGADNLEAWPARIEEPDGTVRAADYWALNLIGLIAAADLTASLATVHPGGPRIDVDFDRLLVAADRARGQLIFRLAENTGAILVHDRLRDRLIARGFTDLDFAAPDEVAL